MAVACRIFYKERKLRKLINQKSIYFLSMYQQTVKTFVKHFSLLHFFKQREREREREAFVVLKQEALRSEDILERTYFPSFQS